MKFLIATVFAPVLAMAAPFNDNFDARADLGQAPSVVTSGTNAGATLQENEVTFNGIAGASVWYEWTAPATGWVRVDTLGSVLDTVIGVFTGDSVSTLLQVGFNDENFDPVELGASHSSRLTFYATAGTAYQVVILGYVDAGITGEDAFQLTIAPASSPGFSVGSVTLASNPVNISTAESAVTLTLDAASSAVGVFAIDANLAPVGDVSRSIAIPITDAQRISGTTANGTYQASFTVPRFVPSGSWVLTVRSSDGARDVWWSVGTDSQEDDVVFPSAGAATLTVINAGSVDSSRPTLASFTASASSVDAGLVSEGERSVTFELHLTDIGAGVQVARVALVSGDQAYELGTVSSAQRLSGDAVDGIYQLVSVIPFGFPQGSYFLQVRASDASGLSEVFSSEPGGSNPPLPSGAINQLAISGTAGYPAWAYGQFFLTGQVDLLADADADGAANISEYAFNLSPSAADATPLTPGVGTAGLPKVSIVGTGPAARLQVEFVRRKASTASGLSYEVQFADTLAETGQGAWATSTATPTVTSLDDTWERVLLEDIASANPRRFARLKVSYSPP
ncbi:MAG: hypothetical protein ACOYMN_04060 [Roseimicrobium sp.]